MVRVIARLQLHIAEQRAIAAQAALEAKLFGQDHGHGEKLIPRRITAPV